MNLFVFVSLIVLPFALSDENCRRIHKYCHKYILNGTVTYPNYANLRTPELIKLNGYPVEVHNITTEDGYILSVQRIPYSNISTETTGKIPVFVMHGLFASSAQWFWQPPNRALVFMLADAGYDVWIGNARGTSYSMGHETLNSNDRIDLRYWDFSSSEMGKYDVPAVINYITDTTGQPSLYWIAHSLGGTQFFGGMARNPDLAEKIRTFFGLAVSGYVGNLTNLSFRIAAPILAPYPNYKVINRLAGGRLVPSYLEKLSSRSASSCANSAIECSACAYGILFTFGLNPCQTNFTTFPGFLSHLPDTVSVKTFSHGMQSSRYGTFRDYDYGRVGNQARYGSATPPNTNWTNYHVPTVMFYGANDSIIVEKDVNRTAIALGSNLKELNKVPLLDWVHNDFITGIDADIYVYNRIIEIMNAKLYDYNNEEII